MFFGSRSDHLFAQTPSAQGRKNMTIDTLPKQEDVVESQEALVELDWFSEGEVVRVCPRDQRRFEIHKDRAIQILQLANDGESQLKLLMDQVGEWVHDNSAKLQGACRR